MPGLKARHTLLATLGGQPQVVTFTLDLLLQRGIPISEVIVIHPVSNEKLRNSIDHLSQEFVGDRYRQNNQTIHFRRHVLTQYNQPIDDIVDEWTASGVLDAIHDLVHDLKQQQRCIHFSITGGRRLMGFLAFSAALLNFDQSDHLWHIHTPEETKQHASNGNMMHAKPEDGVRLIEVPFSRAFQTLFARFVSNETAMSATSIINAQQEQARQSEEQHCQNMFKNVKQKTPRTVLQAFARGLTPQEVADELRVSISTVSFHTTTLIREYRNEWNIHLDDKRRIDYQTLRNAFAHFTFPDE